MEPVVDETVSSTSASSNAVPEDEPACFICLDGSSSDATLGPLGRHCSCPSLYSHRSCLLRWQLQNAGKSEEKQCRFCKSALMDWRQAISDVQPDTAKKPAIMAVVFQGKTVKVPVVTGPAGVAEFKKTVCKLFNLPEGTDFEVTFECKSPVFGDKLHLKGFDCFEAASYCAAVSAAKRASHKAAQQQSRAAAAAAAGTTNGATAPSGAGMLPSPFQAAQAPGSGRSSSSSASDVAASDNGHLSHSSGPGALHTPASTGRAGRLGPSPLGVPSRSAPAQGPPAQALVQPLERGAASLIRRVRAGIRCCSTTITRSEGGAATPVPPAAPAMPHATSTLSTSPQGSLSSTHSAALQSHHSDAPPAAHVEPTGTEPGSLRPSHAGAKASPTLGSTLSSFLRRVL